MFGVLLGKNVFVRQVVGVNSPMIKTMKLILGKPGFGVAKVAILVGGPDWPTSVLCGIMGLPLAPVLLPRSDRARGPRGEMAVTSSRGVKAHGFPSAPRAPAPPHNTTGGFGSRSWGCVPILDDTRGTHVLSRLELVFRCCSARCAQRCGSYRFLVGTSHSPLRYTAHTSPLATRTRA